MRKWSLCSRIRETPVIRQFDYLRPDSTDAAIAMKARHGERARYWAGGTDLMLQWRRGEVMIDHCIDLTHLTGLDGIEALPGEIRIGAMATLDDLDQASSMHPVMQALGDTARLMCTKQTRTLATVGGNMCNASPGADLSPLFVALESRCLIQGPNGQREISMEDFLTGVNRTALGAEELLCAIVVPVPRARREASYRRVARTVVDIALVSAAVSLTADAGTITEARIALGSVAPVPVRVTEGERLLAGRSLDDVDAAHLEEVAGHAATVARPISDVRAGAGYRTRMCPVLVRRALADALGRLRGDEE